MHRHMHRHRHRQRRTATIAGTGPGAVQGTWAAWAYLSAELVGFSARGLEVGLRPIKLVRQLPVLLRLRLHLPHHLLLHLLLLLQNLQSRHRSQPPLPLLPLHFLPA